MKLTRDEIEGMDESMPLERFTQGIKSKATLGKYTQILRKITCEFLEDILDGTFEERVAQLVRHDKEEQGVLRLEYMGENNGVYRGGHKTTAFGFS